MKSEQPSKIRKKHENMALSQKLAMITGQMDYSERINFLTGYFCCYLDLSDSKNTMILRICLQNVTTAVQNQLISENNLIQLFVEVSSKIKSLKPNLEKCMSKLQSQCEDIMGQLVCNRRYLKQKWMNLSTPKPQDSKQKQKIEQIDEQTLKLIKMLQQQDKRKIKQKSALEKQTDQKFKNFMKEEQLRFNQTKKQRIGKQQKKIICDVCTQEIQYQEIGSLTCGHMFHKKCIRGYIQSMVSQRKIDIPCPSGCGTLLNLDDVQEFTDGQLLEKYDKFCFDIYVQKNLDKNTSWCPTAGCPAVFTHDGTLDNYRCPGCRKHYCLSCRCIFHKGMSCQQYRVTYSLTQEDKKFHEFAVGAKFKQCPNCNYWVERTEGCNSMLCRCKVTFCYICGGTGCGHGQCRNSGNR